MPFNYLVSVSSTAQGPWTPFNTVSALTDTVTGLTPNTTFFFQVIPVDQTTNQQGPATVAGPVLTQAVSTVGNPNGTNFAVSSPTTTSVTLSMTAPAGVTGSIAYSALYKRFCDFTWIPFDLGSSSLSSVSLPVTGLTANTLYNFRMNANGSRYSNWLTLATATGGATVSPDGTMVSNPTVQGSFTITSSGAHVWSLLEVTRPFQIAVDTVADTSTKDVVFLVWSGGKVYYLNKDGFWFFKTLPTDAWTATNDPRVGVPTG